MDTKESEAKLEMALETPKFAEPNGRLTGFEDEKTFELDFFYADKDGYGGHVQVKNIDSVDALVETHMELVEKAKANGWAARERDGARFTPKTPSAPRPAITDAATEVAGGEPEGDGECPNGCGPRPLVPAGISKTKTDKFGKPKKYTAFWGECRTCGFKGR